MPRNDKDLEIEVKFFLNDPDWLRRRLAALGCAITPRVFESNRCYENQAQNLHRSGKLLRLRRDQSWHLTFKSKPSRNDFQFKVFEELEVSVNDGETMDAILIALGFQPVQVYEKWRETTRWLNTEVCIDTMPFGAFMEIEGDPAGILAVSQQLDFNWDKRIITNYLAIFDLLRQKERLPFRDATFANFKDRSINITPYLEMLYAGKGSK